MPSRDSLRQGDYIQIAYGLKIFYMSIGTLGLADHFEVLKYFLDFFLKQGDLLQPFCGLKNFSWLCRAKLFFESLLAEVFIG